MRVLKQEHNNLKRKRVPIRPNRFALALFFAPTPRIFAAFQKNKHTISDSESAIKNNQINAYHMAIEKDDASEDFKEKLQMYQNLKMQYLEQKLKEECLDQKSLTDTDSRRMKNDGSLDICYNVQSVVDAKNHFVIDILTTNDINDQN